MRKYPEIFQQDDAFTVFLEEYPYFLPCFAGAVINTIMLVISFFFMDETCVKLKADQEKSSTKLLIQTPRSYSTFDYIKRHSINFTPALPRKQNLATILSLRECFSPAVTNMLLIHTFLIFQLAYIGGMYCSKKCLNTRYLIQFTELAPIWMSNERQYGGLGFPPKQCAIAMASQGISQMITIIFILTPLTKRFGTLRVMSTGAFGLVFATIAELGVRYLYNLPDLHGHTQTYFWVLPAVALCIATWSTSFSLATVSTKILLINAAPQHALGKTNSVSECLSSAALAIAPALCGIIWSG